MGFFAIATHLLFRLLKLRTRRVTRGLDEFSLLHILFIFEAVIVFAENVGNGIGHVSCQLR